MIQRIRQSGFIKSVAVLMSGYSMEAVLGLLLVPIISRLYAPTEFGVAALFASVVALIGVGATLSYERAVILPESDFEGRRLAWLASGIALAVGGLILAARVLTWWLNLPFPLEDRLSGWEWLLGPAVMLFAGTRIAECWLMRRKAFRIIAISGVARTAVNNTGRIASALAAGGTIWGLIISYLVGLGTRLALSLGLRPRTLSTEQPDAEERPGWIDCASRYRDFPKFNAPSAMLRYFSQNLPVLVMGVVFMPAVVGYIAMATRVVGMPVNIVSRSVRIAYLQKTAELRNKGRALTSAWLKTTLTLAGIGVVPFLVLFFAGQEILTFVLGDKWVEAGQFAEILSPMLLSAWITLPSAALFVVLRRQKFWLSIQITLVILQVLSFVVANFLDATPGQALGGFVAVNVVANGFIIVLGGGLARSSGGQNGLPTGPMDSDAVTA